MADWLPVITNLFWGLAVGLFCGVTLVLVRRLSRMLIAHLKWHALENEAREAAIREIAQQLDGKMREFGFHRVPPGSPPASTH